MTGLNVQERLFYVQDRLTVQSEADARHIAVAAVNNIDYILTWNFSHMANTITMPVIRRICEEEGYSSPIITTPNQLKGGLDIGR